MACDECQHPVGKGCHYSQCPTGLSVATCDGAKWHLETGPCYPCGTDPDKPCGSGSLCVHPGGLGDMPYCAVNPCNPADSVSCSCAGSLCTYGYCSSATSGAVYCDCPNC